jgi:hypothetical protein
MGSHFNSHKLGVLNRKVISLCHMSQPGWLGRISLSPSTYSQDATCPLSFSFFLFFFILSPSLPHARHSPPSRFLFSPEPPLPFLSLPFSSSLRLTHKQCKDNPGESVSNRERDENPERPRLREEGRHD